MNRIHLLSKFWGVEFEKLSDSRLGEPSEIVRRRVEAARECQRQRFAAGGAKHPEEGKAYRTNELSPIQCYADLAGSKTITTSCVKMPFLLGTTPWKC